MKSFAAVIAAAVLGVTGNCRADDGSPKPLSYGPAAPSGVEPTSVAPPSEAVLVARKAILYEEDLTTSGMRHGGTAVWRIEQTTSAPGQKPDTIIRADIEFPEQKMSVRLALRRNDDQQLPVSHTVEVTFTLPPGFAHGSVADVSGIAIKQGEATRGSALNGVRVKVMDGFFLIGLSAKEVDVQRNIQLLKEGSWFGIPVVYTDGKRALIAIEKGASGERAFGDALDVWGDPVVRYAALPPALQSDPVRPVPGPTVVIAGDKGGLVREYYERYRMQVATGSTFRIDGRCASACTIILAWPDRVCITRRAAFGFHQVRDKRTGQVTVDTRRVTESMLSIYPAPVRDYIAAHGGLPKPAGMLWVAGDALRGLVKPCE